jgi:hypothetical protein
MYPILFLLISAIPVDGKQPVGIFYPQRNIAVANITYWSKYPEKEYAPHVKQVLDQMKPEELKKADSLSVEFFYYNNRATTDFIFYGDGEQVAHYRSPKPSKQLDRLRLALLIHKKIEELYGAKKLTLAFMEDDMEGVPPPGVKQIKLGWK